MNDEPQQSIATKFGLSRDNFILDPVDDHACFARDDIRTQDIAESLDIDVVTGLAPKRLVWGPYGAGKTHTLMRTVEELGHLTSIHQVRIECPDLAKKSRFHDLYREGIMRGIGQDFVIDLLNSVRLEVGMRKADELRAELKKWFRDEEVGRAAERLYDPNFEALKLWRWISGVPMSRSDLDALGQTQDLTQTEAARLADIIVMLGRILRELKKTSLVLILDEMERLKSIGPETITTFVSGFTRLVDPNQTSVCILIGASAEMLRDMVDVFGGAGPVASRLGADAMIQIPALPDPDVNKFIAGVLAYIRKPDYDVQGAIRVQSTAQDEELTDEFYPFTTEAVEAVKSRTQILTPREITMQMTRALGRAHRKSMNVISSECIS